MWQALVLQGVIFTMSAVHGLETSSLCNGEVNASFH